MARSRLSTNPNLRGNRVRTSTGNTTNSVRTKNFVRVEPVELARQERYFANAMFAIILSLLCSIRQGFRTRAAIQAEILALRHQLLILQRSVRTHKVRLTASDRFLWVWLSRLWREWRSALVIVKPETVIAWHRRGFRLYWSWKSRHPQGRPSLSRELIDLIRRMSFGTVRPARMEFLVGTTVGAVRI